MSAAVCGKRPFFEDHYATSANMKKSRRGSSPICLATEALPTPSNVDTSQDQEQLLVQLHELFPNMSAQLLKEILVSCGNNLDSAIERLQTIYADIGTRHFACEVGSDVGLEGPSTSQAAPLESSRLDANAGSTAANGRQWVELVVREMLSASDVTDARSRATRALEAFEKAMKSQSGFVIENLQKENAVMKEQLQGFLRDNHLLKRAVAIQFERRQGEQENWSREVEHLKQLLSHQQEHVKALELSNYALNVHLRRFQAGNASTIMERFHPDVF